MHVKHSEQDLECTHHTESINFFSVSKYCQRGLCDKETHHGEVIRTLLAPEPSSLKNKGRRCFSRGCRIQKGRSRTGYLICRAWYKMKMKGSRVQKLLIKEIKVATAEPLTQLGATLSPEPCVMAWGTHA